MEITPKRARTEDEPQRFAAALRVLLWCRSDLVSGHEMQATLAALLASSRAVRHVLSQWAREQLTRDVSRGHEDAPIRVEPGPHALGELLLLLRFTYTTHVRIPVPRERHALPRDDCERRRRDHDDVARVVRGRRVALYAQFSHATGWGIHVDQPRAAPGEYVGEYTGELVSSAEAARRHACEYDRARLNYVLALRERTREGGAAVRTNVDATRCGSVARLFNHSCAPTLRVEAVRVDSFVPRLAFFTRRELARGEQLTFDYGSVVSSRETPPTAAVPCHCGAPSCRGAMPFDASL